MADFSATKLGKFIAIAKVAPSTNASAGSSFASVFIAFLFVRVLPLGLKIELGTQYLRFGVRSADLVLREDAIQKDSIPEAEPSGLSRFRSRFQLPTPSR